MIEKKTILICISFIIIVCFSMQNEISIVICAVESEEIELTEAIISIAFEKIHEAEGLGAKPNELVILLNEAQDELTNAKIALGHGNTEEAEIHFSQSLERANYVIGQSEILGRLAHELSTRTYWNNVYLVAFGGIISLMIFIFGWRRFKSYYVRKMYRMRPEVVSIESV